MAAIVAYVWTLIFVLLFLAINQITGLLLEDLLYSRRPFKSSFSWVSYTVVYITAIYVVGLVTSVLFLRGSRQLDAVDSTPRRVDALYARLSRYRWDYGTWPYFLAVIVTTIGIATFPAVTMHLIQPVSWTLFALLVPTLLIFADDRDHLPIPEIPGAETIAESVALQAVSPKTVIEHLRVHPRYRGQLRATLARKARQSHDSGDGLNKAWAKSVQQGGLLHTALLSFGYHSPEDMPAHQRDALDWLLVETPGATQRHHVVLSTGPGSGRHMITFLMMLDRTLRRGSHVLIVAPNDDVLHEEYARFREYADRTDWHYAIHEALIVLDDTPGISDPPPEIVFCTVETLHQRILRDTQLWAEFFDGLEVVIAHDADQYTGIFGANVAQVFRRLKLAVGPQQQHLQYVTTMQPARNAAGFAAALFGISSPADRVHVFNLDTSPRPDQVFGVWIPPLDRLQTIETNGQSHRQIQRQDSFEAIVDLAAMLLSIPGYRLLIHNHSGNTVNPEHLANRIDRAMDTTLSEQRLRITTHESQLDGVLPVFDGMIILDAPAHLDDLERISGTLGQDRGGGVALALAVHSPGAMRMIRSIQSRNRTFRHQAIQDPLSRTLPIGVRHPSIVAKHLQCAAATITLRESEIRSMFGRVGVDIAHEWAHAGFADWDEITGDSSTSTVTDRFLILSDTMVDHAWEHCYLTTIGSTQDAMIPIRSAADGFPQFWIDNHQEAIKLYPRRTLTIAGTTMALFRTDDGDYIADTPPASKNGVRSVTPRYALDACVSPGTLQMNHLPTQIDSGRLFLLLRQPLTISQHILAVREITEHGTAIHPTPGQRSVSYLADALVLTTSDGEEPFTREVAHTLAHALRIAIQLILPDSIAASDVMVMDVQEIDSFMDRPCLIVCDTVDRGLGLMDTILSDMPNLLRDAFRVLIDCPCQVGCPACVGDLACTNWQDTGSCVDLLDKRATIQALGAIIGSSAQRIAGMSVEQMDQVRYESVTDVNDLVAIRERVFDLGLFPLLGASANLHGRASLRFMTNVDRERVGCHAFGFYDPEHKEIAVQRMPEQQLVGTIAHEYAHDWQYSRSGEGTPNIHPTVMDSSIVPWDGQLLIEGFAQWVELRVLDAYGFKQDVDDISFRFFDSYGEGFQIIKHIEDQLGVAGVIDLMRSPIEKDCVRQLMIQANTMDRVIAIARQLESGELELPTADILAPTPSVPDAGEQVNDSDDELALQRSDIYLSETESAPTVKEDASTSADSLVDQNIVAEIPPSDIGLRGNHEQEEENSESATTVTDIKQ